MSVVKQLQVCAERKFYLQEFVAVAVCRVLGSVPKGVVREELVPVLGLGGGWKNCTPETLYVLLELNRGYEKVLGIYDTVRCSHSSNLFRTFCEINSSPSLPPSLPPSSLSEAWLV